MGYFRPQEGGLKKRSASGAASLRIQTHEQHRRTFWFFARSRRLERDEGKSQLVCFQWPSAARLVFSVAYTILELCTPHLTRNDDVAPLSTLIQYLAPLNGVGVLT